MKDEPAHLDTSTPEGFRHVIMHCHEYGFDDLELHYIHEGDWKRSWCQGFRHLVHNIIREKMLYRIKPPAPARVPKVGDVYKYDGVNILLMRKGEGAFLYVCANGHTRSVREDYLIEYIGHIDLSILTGEEK